jgi:hypothetical protein
MNVTQFQQGILKWFLMEPLTSKTEQSVKTVCNNYLIQEGDSTISRNYKYDIIYPLLKLGVLEFYGRDYRLSPSISLQKGDFILFCNIPIAYDSKISDYCYFESGLGIQIYKYSSYVTTYLREIKIPILKFSLNSLLKETSLENILASFPSVKILESTGFYHLDEFNNWQRFNFLRKGVYKGSKEVYAPKLLMRNVNDWCMLSNNWNDLPIAVLWSKIENDQKLDIQYDRIHCQLKLNKEYFPLILERLLMINTLLEGKCDNYMDRNYYVNNHEFRTINKIFNHRITVL